MHSCELLKLTILIFKATGKSSYILGCFHFIIKLDHSHWHKVMSSNVVSVVVFLFLHTNVYCTFYDNVLKYYILFLTKNLSSRYNFLKTCFGMTHAIISSMCCSVFHCFKYIYSLSMLTIWNLKYINSYNFVKYIRNNSYLYSGGGWKWSVIIAVNSVCASARMLIAELSHKKQKSLLCCCK